MEQTGSASAETAGAGGGPTFTPRIKLVEKLGFCAISTSSNIMYQFRSLYYLFFLTNVLRIDILWAGYILTIGTIWDAVNDPLIGFWAVNHKFKNGERVRPLALWASFPWAVTIILIFTDFGASNRLTIAIAVIAYFVYELFNTYVAIPYNSMGSLATNVDADRRSINVFRNIGGCLGSGIGAVACLPLLTLFGALDGSGNLKGGAASSRGFVIVATLMGVICVIGCLVHYFTTRERVKPINDEDSHISVKEVTRMLVRCRSWIFNTMYVALYGMINLLLMSCIAYYATYILKSTAAATVFQAAYLAASVAASFIIAPIDRVIGRKRTMLLGAAVFILGKIPFIIDPFSVTFMYINAVTTGIGVTITFVMFNTNRNNIVDLIEWKDGRRIDGLVSTADNLAAKLATAGATLAITSALAASGFDANLGVQPQTAIDAINALLGWAPMLLAALMLVVIFFLNVERETKIMIEEKNAAS